MITQYHRPITLDEALRLLALPDTIPLGGGTAINTPAFATSRADQPFAVVDLQALGLNQITAKGNSLEIGASVTLQQLFECEHIPAALKAAIRQEAALNIRNAATVAGRLVACDGRSDFATAMLALDADLILAHHESTSTSLSFGNFLSLRQLNARLITAIMLSTNVRLAFDRVARTPADRPILCVALAQWPSGRTRLAIGGFGAAPLLAMDGNEAGGIASAARNACHDASDPWASAEYRMDAAATLAGRCLTALT